MGNLNKVFLMGRLTRDPQQRFLPSGQAVTELGLAINNVFISKGEKREETTFVDIEAWGPQGDAINKYMKKGRPLFVEGRLKFDSWQTKEGEKRSKLRVVLDRFQFIDGGQGGGRGQGGGADNGGGEISPQDFGVEPPPAGGESEVPF